MKDASRRDVDENQIGILAKGENVNESLPVYTRDVDENQNKMQRM